VQQPNVIVREHYLRMNRNALLPLFFDLLKRCVISILVKGDPQKIDMNK